MGDRSVWHAPRATRHAVTTALRAAIAGAFKAMPDIRYELVRGSFGPGLVVLELLVTGTQPDGRRVRLQACDVMTMRGNKVAAKRSYRKVVE